MLTFNRILVAVDGSATSNKALAGALDVAVAHRSRLCIVHLVDELQYMTGFEAAAEVLTIIRENAGKVLGDAQKTAQAAAVEAESRLVDEPGERLGDIVAREAKSWKADLVVVGTHGRRGLGRVLLGSGAEQILRLSPVPVLVIRSDEAG